MVLRRAVLTAVTLRCTQNPPASLQQPVSSRRLRAAEAAEIYAAVSRGWPRVKRKGLSL